MAGLEAIGLVLTAVSGFVSAAGTIAAGEAAKADAEFRAKQMEMKANEERAAGQRQMFERNREKEYQLSRIRAVAGAASGDTTDTGILDLSGDVEQRGDYLALTEMYKGENAGRGYETAASGERARGDAAAKGAKLRAFGSILETGSSMFSKYNRYDDRLSPRSSYAYG